MRPADLKTKIFLDSGDAKETQKALDMLGFLDGQTTNPSYFAKSESIQKRIKQGKLFSKKEIHDAYKKTIQDIHAIIPNGSISIEVYAESASTADQMMTQAREMYAWIPNAHIKLPTTKAGLEAATQAVKEGIRINMTLCFSQEQAAAVYAATCGAKPGSVYVSPFMGRHYDEGRNGFDLVKNILTMYKSGDGHVKVLAASLRSIAQFYSVIDAGTDIITASLPYLQLWSGYGLKLVSSEKQSPERVEPIPYLALDLTKQWTEFNIQHPMTDKGLEKFTADWNALIKKS